MIFVHSYHCHEYHHLKIKETCWLVIRYHACGKRLCLVTMFTKKMLTLVRGKYVAKAQYVTILLRIGLRKQNLTGF